MGEMTEINLQEEKERHDAECGCQKEGDLSKAINMHSNWFNKQCPNGFLHYSPFGICTCTSRNALGLTSLRASQKSSLVT